MKEKKDNQLKLDFGIWSKIFALPCDIVDSHIKLASGNFLKVVLYLFRNPDLSFTPESLSESLKLPLSEIEDALLYWKKSGILCTCHVFDEKSSETESNEQPNLTIKITSAPENPQKEKPEAALKFPPRPKPSEIIKRKSENPEISSFLIQCEKVMDKMLTVTEMVDFVWYYDGLGLNFDIILMLLKYCKNVNKTSLAYISAVAVQWWESDINTHQKAKNNIIYLEQLNAHQSAVKKAFGIYNRKLTKKESEYIETWFLTFKYDISIIEKAFEVCVNSTGKISFPYINKTLTAWFGANLTTIADIDAYNDDHKKSTYENSSNENPVKYTKKSKPVKNVSQSSLDLDMLDDFVNSNIRKSPKE